MFRRWFFASLFGLLGLGAAASLWPLLAPPRLNVIILSVESTPRHMVRPDTAPNLLRAAEGALRFGRHRAISAWTAPNIMALLTGMDAFELGIHAAGDRLAREQPTPLAGLGRDGWRVAGLQAFMLIEQFQHAGLLVEPGEALRGWLAARRLDGQPFVLWHHYLGTHLPYAPDPAFMPDWRKLLPPGDAAAVARIQAVMRQPAIPAGSVAFAPGDREAVVALHEATLRQFDAWFAAFWELFHASGLNHNTILVVTADHGEEHLERGQVGHASTTHAGHLHEEIVSLPLFVWLPPDLREPPRDISHVTRHTDVMPSLMTWLQGGRNVPLLADRGDAWTGFSSRAGFAEGNPHQVRHFVAAILQDGWKLLRDYVDGTPGHDRLYFLPEDPGEQRNRLAEDPDRAARLGALLDPRFAARRQDMRGTDAPAGTGGRAPGWVYPAHDISLRHDDVAQGFILRWQGAADAGYLLQYEAGQGLLALKGELALQGLEKDFGPIDGDYWQRYVLPYGQVRLRIGLAGRDDAWSDWITVRVLP